MKSKDFRVPLAGGPALLALVAALSGCSRSEPSPASNASATGAAVFNRICATCHQPTGRGVPGVFPPLAGSEVVDGDPHRLVRIVLNGLQGPVQIKAGAFNGVMPAQGPNLSNDEIAAVLTYVRSSWDHQAPAVTPEQVAAERALGRTAPWTWDELNAAQPANASKP